MLHFVLTVFSFLWYMRQPVVIFSVVIGVFVGLIGLFSHHDDITTINNLTLDLLDLYSQDDFDFAGEQMPLTLVTRQAIDREITFLVMNIPQLVVYHKRAALYFPLIEQKLAEAGVPDDFKYVAVAESSLRPDALSSASALGIWQFVPGTATEYGLRIEQ